MVVRVIILLVLLTASCALAVYSANPPDQQIRITRELVDLTITDLRGRVCDLYSTVGMTKGTVSFYQCKGYRIAVYQTFKEVEYEKPTKPYKRGSR